jgi:hypothetical protein
MMKWELLIWRQVSSYMGNPTGPKSQNLLFIRPHLLGHSILVSTFISEGGPKNPSKGTSMKLLVFALDAQSGVNAGSKE